MKTMWKKLPGVKVIAPGLLTILAGVVAPAWAGTLDLGQDVDARYTLTLGYALAMRTRGPDDALVNGPTDPQTGLPTTINSDDGDRNFKKGSLVNNRVSALGELFLSTSNYGVVLRGDAIYDEVYHERDDNDSPSTVNKTGPYNQFTADARHFDGARIRLLDAYAYGDWNLGGPRHLNLRLGQQLVAWGESLYFSGIASTQGPADATKANVPGVEIKSILLPVNQVAMQLSVTDQLSLLGYYHLQYKATELDPVGDYFSTTDVVGPGAQFIYLSANPVYGSVPGATPTLTVQREGDITPGNHGQWGAGLKYQITGATNVGLYQLRYDDTNPEVQLNLGYGQLAPGLTTSPSVVPVTYNVRYFDGISLTGASASTSIGPVNVAGEISYRDGIDMLVNTALGPTATRGRLGQALVSAIYTVSPNIISQEIDLVGEAGYIHVNGVDAVMGSTVLTNDRNASGIQGSATFNYRNVFAKWDLAVPVNYGIIVKGTPAMAGAFGSLYGEHDQRLGVATNFTYLQNFQVGLSYNAFLGGGNLSKRPYADRDYAAVDLKYSF